jgi:DNA replication protein DnaC
MTASDGISYQMAGCSSVCILEMFLAPNLTDRSGEIPKRKFLSKIEYKARAPSSANFTGRRDYLTKLRDFFSAESDGPLRRKSFLLYGMGGIGKTQICMKFTEENSDL